MIIKVDPNNGDEVWTHTNNATEYALACVESSDNYIYYGGVEYEEGLSITKLSFDGEESWTNFIENTEGVIPYDLDIDNDNHLFYGGHTGRVGAGDPFDYTCVKINIDGNLVWIKHLLIQEVTAQNMPGMNYMAYKLVQMESIYLAVLVMKVIIAKQSFLFHHQMFGLVGF